MTGHRPPHLQDRAVTTSKKGFFFIPGDQTPTAVGIAQRGSMYVEWESHEAPTQPYPVVLIHGGGGQATDFKGTPDGRPGWFDHFVEAGFAVYSVDRPGHGRSPHHPDVLGPTGPQFTNEFAQQLFVRGDPLQTQWIGEPVRGDPVFDQYVASAASLMGDLHGAQQLDGERIAALLDVIGPAVLVTHSAGAPAGWFAAAKRPGLVRAIAAIEPFGPPFADVGGLGRLEWGLTYAPLDPTTEQTSAEFEQAPAPIAGLDSLAIAVVVGSASQFVPWADPTAAFLRAIGADAAVFNLGDHGHLGNGHGLMFERNSDDNVKPVIEWIEHSA